MFSGELKCESARCRALSAVCVMVLLVVMGGCGGQDDNQAEMAGADAGADAGALATPQAMVPSGTGGTAGAATDSLPIVRPMEAPTGTPPAENTTIKAVASPTEAGNSSGATSPFHRPQGQNITADGAFSLQLGSFSSEDNANRQANRLRDMGHAPTVEVATLGGQTYHRVVLRGLADRDEAERLGENIHSQLGITYLIRQK